MTQIIGQKLDNKRLMFQNGGVGVTSAPGKLAKE